MSFGYSSSGGGGSVRSVSAMNNSSTEIGFRFSRARAVLGHRARGCVEGPALAAMLQQPAGGTSACRSRVATWEGTLLPLVAQDGAVVFGTRSTWRGRTV